MTNLIWRGVDVIGTRLDTSCIFLRRVLADVVGGAELDIVCIEIFFDSFSTLSLSELFEGFENVKTSGLTSLPLHRVSASHRRCRSRPEAASRLGIFRGQLRCQKWEWTFCQIDLTAVHGVEGNIYSLHEMR